MARSLTLALLFGGLLVPAILASSRALPADPRIQIKEGIALGIRLFETKDLEGVMALVSDQYRTDWMTKGHIRAQIQGIFTLWENLRVELRIHEIRMTGKLAVITVSGEVTGSPRYIPRGFTVLSWDREWEVARLEAGGWRLYGTQR